MGEAVVLGSLSIFDRVFLGLDEAGEPVNVVLAERNLLVGGEPGGGQVGGAEPDRRARRAVAGLPARARRRQAGRARACGSSAPTRSSARPSTRPSRSCGTCRPRWTRRYERLLASGRRKIGPEDGVPVILAVFDEVAYFSATVGEPKQQKEFTALLRDLVARGRAAGVIVIAATQRPSADIIPTSLRDLFGYRWAFRCSTEASSDVILGHGWAQRGYCATDIDPAARGVGWLIAEGGIPRRVKSAFLSDLDAADLAAYAAKLRGKTRDGAA